MVVEGATDTKAFEKTYYVEHFFLCAEIKKGEVLISWTTSGLTKENASAS